LTAAAAPSAKIAPRTSADQLSRNTNGPNPF
jgi:hypothetical protein